MTSHRNTVNGKATKEYVAWRNMKHRCTNPNSKYYPHYGGRGINVCERWMEFANFYADMGPCPGRMTLERIDNDAGYHPKNCRWADRKAQANNRRNNILVLVNGTPTTVAEASRTQNIPVHKIRGDLAKQARMDAAKDWMNLLSASNSEDDN